MSEDNFNREKDHLVKQITEGLKDASVHIGVLNRNLSHILQVGKSFEQTANIWNQFCDNISADVNSGIEVESGNKL